MKYLIFGGTGSLGTVLTKRILQKGDNVSVFARGEERHRKLKSKYPDVQCILGDIRDYDAVWRAIKKNRPDRIIQASALKQVPICEEYPEEAVLTNINGALNLNKALMNYDRQQIQALSISTDKAAMPVNSYGMSKALQERIHLNGQKETKHIHNAVRYGNVLESTGSVIPVFKSLIKDGKNLKITHQDMTRFLLDLDTAVDLIFEAMTDMGGQKVFIPKIKSARIVDLADCMIEKYKSSVKKENSSIRPGEKIHEILFSQEETNRIQELNDKYVIHDINKTNYFNHVNEEYSSGNIKNLMSKEELNKFLEERGTYNEL